MRVKRVEILKHDQHGNATKILVNGKHKLNVRGKLVSWSRIFILKDIIIKLDCTCCEYNDSYIRYDTLLSKQIRKSIKKWKRIQRSKYKHHFQAILSSGKTKDGVAWLTQKYSPLKHQMKKEQIKKIIKISRIFHLSDVGGYSKSTYNCAIRQTDKRPIIYDYAI